MTARIGDVIEQAARVLWDNNHLKLASVIDAGTLAQRLADAGLLRQEPPTRDEITRAIYDALSGQYGDFRTPTDAADAVLALLDQPPARDVEAEARAEAERQWPSYPSVGFSGAEDRQHAFVTGAKWATGGAR